MSASLGAALGRDGSAELSGWGEAAGARRWRSPKPVTPVAGESSPLPQPDVREEQRDCQQHLCFGSCSCAEPRLFVAPWVLGEAKQLQTLRGLTL